MANPYNYRIGSTQLDPYCDSVRILGEIMAGKRGNNFVIPGLEGELSFPNKLHLPLNLAVEVTVKYVDITTGLITHVDGAAGHVHENLAKMKELFGGVGSLVQLKRDAPHQGENILEFEVLTEPSIGELDNRIVFLCHAPSPFWRSDTAATPVTGTGTVTRGGNAPVHDAIITFGGNGSIVTNDGKYGVEIAGSSGSGIVVDCGARTILQAGTKRDAWFRPLNNRWFRLDSPSVPVTVTGSLSMVWFPKWR